MSKTCVLVLFMGSTIISNAFCRSVVVWGSAHNMLLKITENPCSAALKSIVQKLPQNEFQKKYNLYLGTEQVEGDVKFSNSIENLKVRTYSSVYSSWALMMVALSPLVQGTKSPDALDEINTLAIFVSAISSFFDAQYPLLTEVSKGYVQKNPSKNIDVMSDIYFLQTQKPASAYPFKLMYFTERYKQNGHSSKDAEQLKTYLKEWLSYGRSILVEYYQKHLQPMNNELGFKSNIAGSSYRDKAMWEIIEPNKLFSDTNLLRLDSTLDLDLLNVVSLSLRDYFIAQNIVTWVKNKPGKNLLIWFGQDHLAGVVNYLREMSNDENLLQEIAIIDSENNEAISCDANLILAETLVAKDSVPADQYFANTLELNLKVFDLSGRVVLEKHIDGSDDSVKNYFFLRDDFAKQNLPSGVYFVKPKSGAVYKFAYVK